MFKDPSPIFQNVEFLFDCRKFEVFMFENNEIPVKFKTEIKGSTRYNTHSPWNIFKNNIHKSILFNIFDNVLATCMDNIWQKVQSLNTPSH